jgi:hypothetical protein
MSSGGFVSRGFRGRRQQGELSGRLPPRPIPRTRLPGALGRADPAHAT